MDRKSLRNDIILILSLLLVAAVAMIVILSLPKPKKVSAKISVANQVVETIDLSLLEEKDYFIEGTKGKLHVHTKEGSIAVLESNCPHQDCVHMGYTNRSDLPIICAYNQVVIQIVGGSSLDDVVI